MKLVLIALIVITASFVHFELTGSRISEILKFIFRKDYDTRVRHNSGKELNYSKDIYQLIIK